MRGTFGNVRIKNLLLDGKEGGYTVHFPTGDELPIYDASMRYQADGTQLVVIAGKEYGTGSSRDWAAKGTILLGVRAVIAETFAVIAQQDHQGSVPQRGRIERVPQSRELGIGVGNLGVVEIDHATGEGF